MSVVACLLSSGVASEREVRRGGVHRACYGTSGGGFIRVGDRDPVESCQFAVASSTRERYSCLSGIGALL